MARWHGYYSTSQVSRLGRVPLRTLYEWRERGIIRPSVEVIAEGLRAEHGYSYADLTIIKIMRALRDDRLDLKSVGVALRHLFDRLGPPSRGWADSRVYILEDKVYAERSDEWAATAATRFGQKVETRLFGDMFEELRGLEEAGSILVPQDFSQSVEIGPDVMGGDPVVKKTRVPTAILATLYKRGRSLKDLAELYRPIPQETIKAAIDYEEYLHSAITETRTPRGEAKARIENEWNYKVEFQDLKGAHMVGDSWLEPDSN